MPEFAAMTAGMDAAVGQVLDTIDELGLRSSTRVFFLSDNGGRATLRKAGHPPMLRNPPPPCAVRMDRCTRVAFAFPSL